MPAGRRLSAEHAGTSVTGGNQRVGLAPLACPVPHGPIAAGKAEAGELAPEQGSVAAALRPALFKVAEIGASTPTRGGLRQSEAPPAWS